MIRSAFRTWVTLLLFCMHTAASEDESAAVETSDHAIAMDAPLIILPVVNWNAPTQDSGKLKPEAALELGLRDLGIQTRKLDEPQECFDRNCALQVARHNKPPKSCYVP